MRQPLAAKSSLSPIAPGVLNAEIACETGPPVMARVLLITWLNYFFTLGVARHSLVSNRGQARSNSAELTGAFCRLTPGAAMGRTPRGSVSRRRALLPVAFAPYTEMRAIVMRAGSVFGRKFHNGVRRLGFVNS
jgi:hypothetical protein